MKTLMNGTKKEIKMGREAILQSIKKNKPEALPMPIIDESAFYEDIDLLNAFKSNIALVGGTIKEIDVAQIDNELKTIYPKANHIVSATSKSTLGTIPFSKETDPHLFKDIDLAIVEGEIGVSENGAVWVSNTNSLVRALPFITNDLVIILNKSKICIHMLHAYDLIKDRDRDFGVFISGPSKTADIEQCLVVGAHGAMSLTVLLI
ncbi:LUD domain-containing protein [Winogradskyella litoriviva]|uniref:LUD domain-containing protein n=1 Tax=Winogradskyella litoriviva TaxID=1220182 RepID=A0ABX2E3E1_9FLAO|nr:LUD domain-containing protein [Winogradskyella litoriviva]NRD23023.1 LUD domain-containing protein [Winogradskyella litoriviva]